MTTVNCCYLVVILCFHLVESSDISGTLQMSATVGDSVLLPCPGSTSTANWQFQTSDNVRPDEICVNGLVINGHNKRFRLESNSSHQLGLGIIKVRLNDTGLFICNTYQGFGDNHFIRLRVSAITESTRSMHTATPLYRLTSVMPGDVQTESHNETNIIVAYTITAIACVMLVIILTLVVVYVLKRRHDETNKLHDGALLAENGCLGDEKYWREILDQLKTSSPVVKDIDMNKLYGLLAHPDLLERCLEIVCAHVLREHPDVEVVFGLDTNGFIVALQTARQLNKPFVPIRKLRKIHGPTFEEKYVSRDKKHGVMRVMQGACPVGTKAVIVHEELSHGGSLISACKLLKRLNVELLGCVVLFENTAFNGREKLSTVTDKLCISSLIRTQQQI